MEPLISVIVPIYKVEKYLSECIDSILQQTYENLQIILVNDGSPDKSGNICDCYSRKDKRILVIHKENGGLSSARNAGLEVAKGNFISFIDSDDYIEKDMYMTMINNIKINNADIAICGRYYVYENGVKVKNNINIYKVMNSEEAIGTMCTFGNYDVASWDKLYKRELFKNIRFPLNKLSEDWFTTYKLLDRANVIVYDSNPKYYYRQRNNSITHSKKINYDVLDASKNVLDLVQKKYSAISVQAITSYVYANIGVYNNILLKDKENTKEMKKIIDLIRVNYKIVINNKELSFSRKIQLKLIKFSPYLYNRLFNLFNIYRNYKLS